MPRTFVARLLMLATGLFALTGQAALILHAPLPGWQYPAIVLDSVAAATYTLIHALTLPRRPPYRSGERW
jgi:hypothetical protein